MKKLAMQGMAIACSCDVGKSTPKTLSYHTRSRIQQFPRISGSNAGTDKLATWTDCCRLQL